MFDVFTVDRRTSASCARNVAWCPQMQAKTLEASIHIHRADLDKTLEFLNLN